MSAENKLMARVPIIPADFLNTNLHKVDELVMNHTTNDLLVKTTNGYVNITGRIKEQIQEITDGTSVIHIVTPDTVPAVIDRKENHWYYIVTSSEEIGGGSTNQINYVFYGLIDNGYSMDTSYLVIGQNMSQVPEGQTSITVTVNMQEGYNPIFYVPISLVINCKINGVRVPFTNGDNPMETIYALNASSGQWTAYKVWVLDTDSLALTGSTNILVEFYGNTYNRIDFTVEEVHPAPVVLPESFNVPEGQQIGQIAPPQFDDGRYIFTGYSSTPIILTPVPETYVPLNNMTLYAFFTYNESPTALTYTVNENGGE